MTSPTLTRLIEWARTYRMTPAEREAQRRSFVYGNVKLSNDRVTREDVDRAADAMAAKEGGEKKLDGGV